MFEHFTCNKKVKFTNWRRVRTNVEPRLGRQVCVHIGKAFGQHCCYSGGIGQSNPTRRFIDWKVRKRNTSSEKLA